MVQNGNHKLDKKLIESMERLTHVFRMLQWNLSKDTGLSPLQNQILFYLNYHPKFHRNVNHIVEYFGLTAATVSASLTALHKKGYINKRRSEEDGRVMQLAITRQGKTILKKQADWLSHLVEFMEQADGHEKQIVTRFLMEFIVSLYQKNVIAVARMCLLCHHFSPEVNPGTDTPHFCNFLEKPLSIGDLRFDCPVHDPTSK